MNQLTKNNNVYKQSNNSNVLIFLFLILQFNCWSICQFNWKEICLHFWNLRHIGFRLFIVCWSSVPLDDAIRAVSSWCRIGFFYHNFYHLYYGGMYVCNEHEWYFVVIQIIGIVLARITPKNFQTGGKTRHILTTKLTDFENFSNPSKTSN